MIFLLPCLLVAAASALGFYAGSRLGLPSRARLTVVAFALLTGIASALSQQFELALTIALSGVLFYGASLVKSKFRTGRLQYRFCPNCSSSLHERDFEGHMKLACPSCSFVYWNNPIVVGVALIPSMDGKSIVLVERGVEPKAGMYCLPGGFGEPFEHPKVTAKREAGEEVKLDIEIDRLLAIHTAPGGNQVLVFYLAKPTAQLPSPGSDAKSCAFFPLDQLPDNIAFTTHIEVISAWKQECIAGQNK